MKKALLVLALFCFVFVGCGNDANKEIDKIDDEVSEENLDILSEEMKDNEIKEKDIRSKGITIVIDPGHSMYPKEGEEPNAPGSSIMKAKDVSGATGVTGVPEYKLNQDISDLLKSDLESRGFNVIMTKTDVSQSMSNVERAEVGNNAGASLVIRIHADSFSDSSAKGASMLVPPKESQYTNSIAEASYNYGSIILNSYISKVPLNSRGVVVRNDMTGFNWSKVPVVILEMGFLSNYEDNEYLTNENNYSIIVSAIGEGIQNCF